MVTEAEIREALRAIPDPELGISIVDLGLVYDTRIIEEKGRVEIDMTLTAMGCPIGPYVITDIDQILKQLPGVKDVDVNIVWDPPWDPSRMSDEAKMMLGYS
ncbi:MAG: metal-sulfur cluster assembly factor [Chloroflexi bacterium]|nr:metal-sulfur cluster assembly factor [Chloroflexota bacterium]